MTDYQAVQLLKAAGIVDARPMENSLKMLLSVRRGEAIIDIPLTEFREGLHKRVRVLDDEKKEILKNAFAARASATFTVGGSAPLTMQAFKSNNQLTKEERREKTRLLMDIDAGMKKERSLLLALAHLQVNSKDVLPQLRPKPSTPPPQEVPPLVNGKQIWTRGVKAAAVHCLHEAEKRQADDRMLFLICKEFLSQFSIEDEVDYPVDRLFENVRQVRLLES